MKKAHLKVKDWGDQRTGSRSGWQVRFEFGLLLALHLIALALFVGGIGSSLTSGHPGGLAADGCHNDGKNGGRHCHRAKGSAEDRTRSRNDRIHYPNCMAARAAGAAPVRRGQPGYSAHLDRDGDGVGCE